MAITKVSDFSISDFPADTTFLLDTNVLYFVQKVRFILIFCNSF